MIAWNKTSPQKPDAPAGPTHLRRNYTPETEPGRTARMEQLAFYLRPGMVGAIPMHVICRGPAGRREDHMRAGPDLLKKVVTLAEQDSRRVVTQEDVCTAYESSVTDPQLRVIHAPG
ncbi:MAG: hypothetical protein LLF90_12170 [Methanomicrobiaceae archaeon]|uniref:hypothetical protein n=1 Tax=Methanoculleus sp. TaxID=90427 RepID=UPI00320C6DA3|nr:hypothetical protein [Methanomicrobiaceae archaeon]